MVKIKLIHRAIRDLAAKVPEYLFSEDDDMLEGAELTDQKANSDKLN